MEHHAYESAQNMNNYRREVVARAMSCVTESRMRTLARALRGTRMLRNLLGEHPAVVDAEYLIGETVYTFFGTDGTTVRFDYFEDVLNFFVTDYEHITILDAPITLMQWATLLHDIGIDEDMAKTILSSCFDHVETVYEVYATDVRSVTE